MISIKKCFKSFTELIWVREQEEVEVGDERFLFGLSLFCELLLQLSRPFCLLRLQLIFSSFTKS